VLFTVQKMPEIPNIQLKGHLELLPAAQQTLT